MRLLRSVVTCLLALLVALCVGCSASTDAAQAPAKAGKTPNWACGSGQTDTPATDPDGPDESDESDGASDSQDAPPPPDPVTDELNAEPMPAGPMFGDPDAADRYWQAQSQGDCGLMASRLIIGEVTGAAPSEEEIIAQAKSTPSECHPGANVYDDAVQEDGSVGSGTCTYDLPLVLKHWDVNAKVTDDDQAKDGGPQTGMDALKRYLGNGHQIMASVNSEIIWDMDGDKSHADHMVTIAAVDAGGGLVYLGDTGGDDTEREQVPVDKFETAWAAGGHELVIIY